MDRGYYKDTFILLEVHLYAEYLSHTKWQEGKSEYDEQNNILAFPIQQM